MSAECGASAYVGVGDPQPVGQGVPAHSLLLRAVRRWLYHTNKACGVSSSLIHAGTAKDCHGMTEQKERVQIFGQGLAANNTGRPASSGLPNCGMIQTCPSLVSVSQCLPCCSN